MRFIVQSSKLFFGKTPEYAVDGFSTHVQVSGNRFGVPPVHMEPNDGAPLGFPILHLRIARVAALGRRGLRPRAQNELNGPRSGLPFQFPKTYHSRPLGPKRSL